ncbi:acyl-CoA dehydrogenase family protein [Actinokineospora sp. NBRC 105648]|uniref:acyl-CoA dehydrogenase family protein n=1 Tax=Actinokineospora sp. NBRC 105648 TaxID=3032206 RepID=UPI0024A4FC92|nr:acyl-CoA dehydrogenase family protein [Actinokineospora sp. NBRC 105648]GLZ37972.1 acyl-CoA dehydrogenase [Actinokineospora sp. NBRC 105648]
MSDLVERAKEIADDVLFPAAAAVDASGRIPASHFELLAAEGFYGLSAPPEVGGPGLGLPEVAEILEALAGGCLATTFTWVQHHGVVLGLAAGQAAARERYLADAVRGVLRGGVAFAGAVPTPPRLRVRQVSDGVVYDGEGPFVSGWGIVDVLQISGRDGDTIVHSLIDARPADGLTAEPLALIAAQATNTVRLRFDGFHVPADRVLATVDHATFLANQTAGSRLNGCLALGVAERCLRLIEETGEDEVVARLRAQGQSVRDCLDAGLTDAVSLLAARAAGSEFALRAASALVVATGSAAVQVGHPAERLLREATFTLVAGGRPPVRAGILDLLSASSGSG